MRIKPRTQIRSGLRHASVRSIFTYPQAEPNSDYVYTSQVTHRSDVSYTSVSLDVSYTSVGSDVSYTNVRSDISYISIRSDVSKTNVRSDMNTNVRSHLS